MTIIYFALKYLILAGYISYVGYSFYGAEIKSFLVHYLYGTTIMMTALMLLYGIFKLVEKQPGKEVTHTLENTWSQNRIAEKFHIEPLEKFWTQIYISIVLAPIVGIVIERGY